jgi:hypothetical protein
MTESSSHDDLSGSDLKQDALEGEVCAVLSDEEGDAMLPSEELVEESGELSESAETATDGLGEESPPEASTQESSETDREAIVHCVERLQRTICGLSEPAGHPNAVAREFFRAGPKVAVEALHRLHEGLIDGQARGAYMGVLRLFIAPKELPYHLKQPMYVYARQKGYLSIAYCFLRPPAQRTRGTGECLLPDPPEGDRTLGERRALARSLDRHVITRVRRDPDPMVVKNLLKNPRLKEEDVVRIAASRPVRAQVLVDVAHHRTWLNAPRVQLTLALNPYTPTHIAVAILPLLHLRDLRDMAGDQNLHVVVREAAEYLVNIRTSLRKGRNHEPG